MESLKRWSAAGGVIGAILASSCCIAPLAFVMLGVSGAWIGNLTALEPFKPIFAALASVFIGLGFWRVYFHPKAQCEDGSSCARRDSAVFTQVVLWIATALVILALTIDWWAKFLY